MHTEILTQLGLAKNEAKIYETLLTEGKTAVGTIALKSKIHRRNVYDSIQRLVEKGLVFEIIEEHDNKYEAVNPEKLTEILQEKQQALDKIMPTLEDLYKSTPTTEAAFIYKGVEGWKNYMRDMLQVGEDPYGIGVKGAWSDPAIIQFSIQISKQMADKGMKSHLLYDYGTADEALRQETMIVSEYRHLPKGFDTSSSIEIFGDRVVLLSGVKKGSFDKDAAFTVIINQQMADAFRIWFKMLWNASIEPKDKNSLKNIPS